MKKSTLCLAVVSLLALSSCISASYRGKAYEPTAEVTIVYSLSELPEDKYQEMGLLEVTADTVCSSDSIVKKVREEAMAKGADAAVVSWFDARFVPHALEHAGSCESIHCHGHSRDRYKYKKLIKVVLLKEKTAEVKEYETINDCNEHVAGAECVRCFRRGKKGR